VCDGGVRRGFAQREPRSAGGAESGGKRLTFGQIAKAIPHVKEGTLSVRLLSMVARGDVMREGERRHYYYTSTAECS
jgi:DNA-binding HxlR family transcriptional regulator